MYGSCVWKDIVGREREGEGKRNCRGHLWSGPRNKGTSVWNQDTQGQLSPDSFIYLIIYLSSSELSHILLSMYLSIMVQLCFHFQVFPILAFFAFSRSRTPPEHREVSGLTQIKSSVEQHPLRMNPLSEKQRCAQGINNIQLKMDK